MVVAVGYKTVKPPPIVRQLLRGTLRTQTSLGSIKGYRYFYIQDLEAYKDEKGNIIPVISSDEITWTEKDNILIGEV